MPEMSRSQEAAGGEAAAIVCRVPAHVAKIGDTFKSKIGGSAKIGHEGTPVRWDAPRGAGIRRTARSYPDEITVIVRNREDLRSGGVRSGP